MENKEIKKNTEALNDESLENVNGGLLKPIIITDTNNYTCAGCNKVVSIGESVYRNNLVNGKYYCQWCQEKLFNT